MTDVVAKRGPLLNGVSGSLRFVNVLSTTSVAQSSRPFQRQILCREFALYSNRPIRRMYPVSNSTCCRYNHNLESHKRNRGSVVWCEVISIRDNVPADYRSKAHRPFMLSSGIRFPSSTPEQPTI